MQVAEIISKLKDPMVREEMRSDDKSATGNREEGEDVKARQLEIAKLRVTVRMNEMRDLLDAAVSSHNFLSAQEIKANMDTLETEQDGLEEQLHLLKGELAVTINPPEREAGPVVEVVDEEQVLDNPAVTLKCLRLLVATLQDPAICSLNATLYTLLEEFVTVSVQSEIAGIRKEAILALACYCLRSASNARQHMLLLLQAAHKDVREVRMAAITAVVDLLMKHGLTSFIMGPADQIYESRESSESRPSEDPSEGSLENCLESDMVTRGATLNQTKLDSQGGNSVVAFLCKVELKLSLKKKPIPSSVPENILKTTNFVQ